MTQARREQVDVSTTPYYHCVVRCVRRAFLCGVDAASGQDFNHRKVWVLERLQLLSEVFAIRICAFAVMSNHLHLVLQVDADEARGMSPDDVLSRYGRVFKTSAKAASRLSDDLQQARVALFRDRLGDLSWFMRCLNEFIARRANLEDGCRGRFWEGRFRCQALLDEAALLTCMSYVDLNPVRAGLADTLEESDFTSIRQRLVEHASASVPVETKETDVPVALVRAHPAVGERAPRGATLPISLHDYTTLLIETGSLLRDDKRGALGERAKGVLAAFDIRAEHWAESVSRFGVRYGCFVGHASKMQGAARAIGRKHVRGQRFAAKQRLASLGLLQSAQATCGAAICGQAAAC